MCCHAGLEDALIFVEIANSTSEMSPAFNLFLSGQYRTLTLVRPRLLNRDLAYPRLPWQQAAVWWDWSRLDGNMEVRNFNINNFWWALCQWLWNSMGIRGADGGYRACCTLSRCNSHYCVFGGKKKALISWHCCNLVVGEREHTSPGKCHYSSRTLQGLQKQTVLLHLLTFACYHHLYFIRVAANVSLSPLFTGMAKQRPPPFPLAIEHNQIYSGSSARWGASICLKQTLRALVCHWQLGTNILQSSSISGCLSPVFRIGGTPYYLRVHDELPSFIYSAQTQ